MGNSSSSLRRLVSHSIHDDAIVAHNFADSARAVQARKIVSCCAHDPIVKAMQKAHEILVDIMPMAISSFAHLNYQVPVVLIPERLHVTVPIAVSIRPMTTGTVFAVNRPTQRQIHAIAGLDRLECRRLVQISRDVNPGLCFVQLLPCQNPMHGIAVAFAAGQQPAGEHGQQKFNLLRPDLRHHNTSAFMQYAMPSILQKTARRIRDYP